jgi:hypothetical protein
MAIPGTDRQQIQEQPSGIAGLNSTGVPNGNYVNADGDGNMYAVDTIQNAISSGSITVSTTAIAARVSSANLANRKMLMISPAPAGGIVYLGASSSVTVSNGFPIYPGQVISFAFSANVTPYLIAAASTTVNIFEGS